MEGVLIKPAGPDDADVLALLVCELLQEIMDGIGSAAFNFNLEESKLRAEDYLRREVYFAFIMWVGNLAVGMACLCESRALYAEGDFGTITELYVRPAYRSAGFGSMLLEKAREFGRARGWKRLELTTPPQPEFQRTLDFYHGQGFAITGGRKLKTLL
jgi:GNAT superfamily N-acetyltransferase